MIVQIYSLTHPDDVRSLVEMGVDHIGFAPAGQGLRSELDWAEARKLLTLLPEGFKGAALTVRTEPEAIADMAEAINPAIVHICCPTEALSVVEQRRLRTLLPEGCQIMKAIDVGGPETATRAIDAAERFAPVSDYLLLDTDDPEITGIGAAGRTHDWDISARIVERVGDETTVILAGGLNPENVGQAIRHVRPAGVDSFSWTNRADDSRRKDLGLVRDFVREARRVAAALEL
jgi:phosphoribosylanthranilate isomerase